jgi:hypothetical protein
MTVKNIYTQLLLCDFEAIEKDAKNPVFRSSYASLPHVLKCVTPVLKQNGIVVNFPVPENLPDFCVVNLTHAESNTSVSSFVKLLIEEKYNQNEIVDPTKKKPLPIMRMQQWGACMTYAQCRGLLGLLGIAANDDDDGNSVLPNYDNRKALNQYVKTNNQIQQKQLSVPQPANPQEQEPKETKPVPVDIEKIKKDLKTLWVLKQEAAIIADDAKATRTANLVLNNFMKLDRNEELVELPLEVLFSIQKWLRNL